MLSESQIVDGITSLPDRLIPRFEVFFAKPPPGGPTPVPQGVADPATAIESEIVRLDNQVFRPARGPNPAPPKLSELIPLAGPWGEGPNQRTDDIVSVEFKEAVDKRQSLAQTRVELLNVFDFERRFYRYTDIPAGLPLGRTGVFPLVEFGDTLAVRIGYGANLAWIFAGVITQVDVDFPADGQSKLGLTAVDMRDRLRGKKEFSAEGFTGNSEEELIAHVVRGSGLVVAAPGNQRTPIGESSTMRSQDQDLASFVTDRASKAALELTCFGNVLLVQKPADDPLTALRYIYRQGLTTFKPTFNGSGKQSRVRVKGRNPTTGETFFEEVASEDLQAAGLIPTSGEGSVAEKVTRSGQAGERVDVVTNYLAKTPEDARRIALGILKRNVDETFTMTGGVIGDPRIRARETLKIEGVGRFDGLYYLTEVTHKLGSNGYQTDFKGRRTTALSEEGVAAQALQGVA